MIANEVLAKHVVRAEANHEITTKSGAVFFMDRCDPGVCVLLLLFVCTGILRALSLLHRRPYSCFSHLRSEQFGFILKIFAESDGTRLIRAVDLLSHIFRPEITILRSCTKPVGLCNACLEVATDVVLICVVVNGTS